MEPRQQNLYYTSGSTAGAHPTGGETVACTQLPRRKMFCMHLTCYVMSVCSLKRTEAVLTTYEFLNFAYVFARKQHALAGTAGCDHGFNRV